MSDRGHRAEKTAMKARHCDECKHATVKWYEYKGPPAFDVLTCAKKHKPRHYMPRNAMDTDYGWKRVCVDFETHNAAVSGPREADNESAAGPGPLDQRVRRPVATERT